MENPSLASLSLTHVHYDPTSTTSYICAWLALVPQALCVIYATLMWSTREAEVILMFAGQMSCEGLNWILKRWIREERPSQMHGKGYGMPSSHAQFVAFFSTTLTLFLLLRHDPHKPHTSSTHVPIPFWQRAMLSVAALGSAAAVAQSRIYLNYHTPRQVYVGVAAGVCYAFVWFAATSIARRIGLLDAILDTDLARVFRIRDLVVSEDFVDAGWERWEKARQRRQANGALNGTSKKKR